MSKLDQLLGDIKLAEAQSRARKDWQPEYCGPIDIRITRDGVWHHEGQAFQRLALCKLFAGILRREGADYFLVTPLEKLSIQVDDAPFVATRVDRHTENNQTVLVFTTSLGENCVADKQHPVRVETGPVNKQPRPYVLVRDGLEALISRNTFFNLIEMADESQRDGQKHLTVSSMGVNFDLGSCEEQ